MKVTLIVPIYNSEKTIKRCIDSIINQTYKNIEVLLINDGSQDNSLNIINKYKDKRIKVIDKKNEGVAKTRNLGIKKATGDYIMFVDNDDFIDRNCIKKFSDSAKDYDVVIGGYKRVNLNEVLYECKLKNTKWSKYIVMAPWAKLYKREFLIKNNINFLDYKIGEDVYFNFLVLSKTKNILILPSTDYNWFYNDVSVSNTIQKGLNSKINIIVLLNKLVSLNNFYEEKLNVYYIYRYIIWYLLFSGKQSTSKQFIQEYNKLKKWKKENGIFLNINPLSKELCGESLKNRFIVFTFSLMEKMHLVGMFSKIYCKGRDY